MMNTSVIFPQVGPCPKNTHVKRAQLLELQRFASDEHRFSERIQWNLARFFFCAMLGRFAFVFRISFGDREDTPWRGFRNRAFFQIEPFRVARTCDKVRGELLASRRFEKELDFPISPSNKM